jgi:hypothetical protein
MRLVIDALELCYAREHINTFAIASGDSDFCPLAYKLRENGRQVIGLAVKEATSPLFVKACDEFIYLRPRTRSEREGKGASEEPSRTRKPAKGGGAPAAAASKGKARAPDIAREVVQSLLARATGPLNPSLIKEAIVRKEPDFDERDHGFSTFTKLLAALEQEGVLKRVQLGRQGYVVGPDTVSESPSRERTRAPARMQAEEEEEEEVYPDPVEDL